MPGWWSAGSTSIPPTPGPSTAPRDQAAVTSGVRAMPTTCNESIHGDEEGRGREGGIKKVSWIGKVELSSDWKVMG